MSSKPNPIMRLRTFFSSLVEPSSEIQDEEYRRRVRLLTSILVFLIPLTFIAGILVPQIDDLIEKDFDIYNRLRNPYYYVVLTGIAMLSAIYPLSRGKRYQRATWVLVGLSLLVLSYIAINDPVYMRTAFSYMLIATLTASLFLSLRGTIIVVIITTVTMGLVSSQIAVAQKDIVDAISVYLVLGSLILLISRLQQQDLEQIEEEVKERKLAEQKQALLIDELDAFAHTVAHGLQKPLSRVIDSSEILLTSENPKDKKREYTERIQQNVKKMDGIISSLLLLAHLRAEQEVEISKLDMPKIIAATLARLELGIQDKEAQIVHPESWPDATGYPQWVEEIWVNIIGHGIKHGGGRPMLTLSAEQKKDSVRFYLKVKGEGLSKEKQSELFAEFTQQEQEPTLAKGLGLSTVQRIAERLDGEVGLENELGAGSRFWFSLPSEKE